MDSNLSGSDDRHTVLSDVPGPCWVWGVPLHPLTYTQTIDLVDALIQDRRPSYFVTANLNTVMLAQNSPPLREAAREAAFVVADGISLVWVASSKGRGVPERVTGSDLIYGLSELAARKGYGVFLLGGPEGVSDAAAARLKERYPGLRVVGTACPPHRALSPQEQEDLLATIRAAHPDLLFVAFGQPKGEVWIREHYQELGIPVSVQVGASIDFVAGRIRRAPLWVQRIHMETPFRILQEPRRLTPRYTRNALFLIRMLGRDAWDKLRGRGEPRNRPDQPS